MSRLLRRPAHGESPSRRKTFSESGRLLGSEATLRTRRHFEHEDDVMKRDVILSILIAFVVSIAGAYAMTAVQLTKVDTREQTRAEETERAIERVSRDSDARIDREVKATKETLDKLDENVQWLVKQQIETRALIRSQQ
jgi:hypothetical protein